MHVINTQNQHTVWLCLMAHPIDLRYLRLLYPTSKRTFEVFLTETGAST